METDNESSGFAQHYNAASASVHGVLSSILEDMTSFRSVHNWEDRLIVSPINLLRSACRKYMQANQHLDFLLGYSIVEEILAHNGMKSLFPAMNHPGDVDKHLFFQSMEAALSNTNTRRTSIQAIDKSAACHVLDTLRGRTVYLDERTPALCRAILLLLFTFCIRLQDEDDGYIKHFITRHLNTRNQLKLPQHWQETAGPTILSGHQKTYKRVSISCHITYLTTQTSDNHIEAQDLIDRTKLFPIHHSKSSANPTGLRLFRASASTLLTIATTDESSSREEQISFLKSPEGFWVVLAVNSPSRFAADEGPPEHLTPIAQYMRGVTSSLVVQRQNAESILDALREKIERSDGDSLFDDEKFTKSNLFHWTVRTCDELRNTISGTLRFMQRAKRSQIDWLRSEAPVSEKLGINYWTSQLDDEVFNLEDVQDQTAALNAQVQESRNALHGATAVLEARVALRQGERIKVLAYLATIYLPLTATASLYSMSVLPSSTTLYSFFIVLILLVLMTFATGYSIAPVVNTIKLPLSDSARNIASFLFDAAALPFVITHAFQQGLTTKDLHGCCSCFNPFWVIPYILLRIPAKILYAILIPELKFPRDQWVMSNYIGNRYVNIRWHPLAAVRDIFRLVFLPVWLALAVVIVAYMSVMGLVFLIFFAGPHKVIKAYTSR